MPKAYFVSIYRDVRDPGKLAAYGKLAGPAIEAAGGRFIARGPAVQVHEAGLPQRTVIIEFPSLAQARAVYDSPAYRTALAELGDGAERDIRIVEGTE